MKKLLLALIRFYQRHISPAFPRRCHPFSKRDYFDPVP